MESDKHILAESAYIFLFSFTVCLSHWDPGQVYKSDKKLFSSLVSRVQDLMTFESNSNDS